MCASSMANILHHLQYCAKVMRANFDEIRALFSSKFLENSPNFPLKFRTFDIRNFSEVGENYAQFR